MSEPRWIETTDCLRFHELLLSRYGGMEGVRDMELLESALSQPLHRFHYENASIHELAASYAQGIVRNHPFLDGNKRTGFLAAAYFLERNGFRLTASEEEAVIMTVDLAAGKIQSDLYAGWLRRNSEG